MIGGRLVLLGYLSLPAVIGSAFLGPRRTAAVGGCAVLAAVLAGIPNGIFGTADHAIRVTIIAAVSAVGVFLARLRLARETQLRQVTAIAEVAQHAVLRALPTAVGRLALAGRYLSATTEALIGGDLYEVAPSPYGVRVIVGDVRGKGLAAVRLASVVLGAFRLSAMTRPDLVEVVRDLDLAASTTMGEEDFVTAVVVEFLDDGRYGVVNAGHHPPLLIEPTAVAMVPTGEPTTPLGLAPHPVRSEHRLAADARLLLYTDGLIEARDESGCFFPLERGVDWPPDLPLESCLDRLVDCLYAHVGGRLQDDLALVLAERQAT